MHVGSKQGAHAVRTIAAAWLASTIDLSALASGLAAAAARAVKDESSEPAAGLMGPLNMNGSSLKNDIVALVFFKGSGSRSVFFLVQKQAHAQMGKGQANVSHFLPNFYLF